MKIMLRGVIAGSLVFALFFVLLPRNVQAGTRPSQTGYPYSTLVDTPTFSIPFVIYPNGLYYSFGANFGIHSGATKGIDPSLGEVEYPPFPPCCAFMMFVTTGGNAFLDLRPYISPTQIDTYTIGVSAESLSYPIVFSWPDLHPYYSGSVRLKSDLTGSMFDIDMKAKTSYTLTSGPFIHDNGGPPPLTPVLVLYIVAEGPLTGTSMPVVSTFGVGNGGFQAIVSAPAGGTAFTNSALSVAAGTTNVWFEYGQTKGYGTSSTPQAVANGTNVNITQPFDPSSLPLNTRIHFRSVAQNSLGTFYGGDRVVSNGTPPPELADSSGLVMYRTATYRDWADAKDQKNKRKGIVYKPDRVALDVRFPCESNNVTDLHVEFAASIDTVGGWLIVNTEDHLTHIIALGGTAATNDPKLKKWEITFNSTLNANDGVQILGTAWHSKDFKITYYWSRNGTKIGGKINNPMHSVTPLIPLPNLHNVGEGIYGGVKQTSVDITVGVNDDKKGAHTVYHTRYADVLKSFVKEKKGGDLYHTKAPHWLNTFDKNGHPILKRQKGLPPDVHNNILFAEALTLKLNVAASDSGIFPKGLGDLLYNNSTPFDGKNIRQIIAEVDSFLGRPPEPPEVVTDSSIYLKIVQDINSAFEGPMDTASWSGGKVICTGVKMLQDVPYLSASPSATPPVVVRRGQGSQQVNRPSGFRLDQNYPNPFNPTTRISFTLPEDALVTLKIYNSLGQMVATLADREEFTSGYNEVEFDGSRLASGVYYYRIQTQSLDGRAAVFSGVKKMLLLK